MSGTASVEAAAWLPRRRADAKARFDVLGIPRPTDEDWRQTNVLHVGPMTGTVAPAASMRQDEMSGLPLFAAVADRAVLVNGRFDATLSTLPSLPRGVRVQGLASALKDAPDALEPLLGRVASDDRAPFVALNTASFEDGVVVTVDAHVDCPVPVHVIHVAIPGSRPASVHPRTLVIAGAGSRLTVVESFVAGRDAPYLTNAVTEIFADRDAVVSHLKIQTEAPSAWHIASVTARQARGSVLTSHNVSLGAALARNDIGSRLDGPGAECRLYGLYVADGTQHVDNHTWLDHAAPNCPSWEMYKGLLADQARAVFCGRIVVRDGAQKTDAKQSNKNLILGDGALVYTRPQLEIHANDVKCTHGATIGRLDDEALFYMRTRGLGASDARNMLVRAFAHDLIDNVPVADIRGILLDALHARLEARA